MIVWSDTQPGRLYPLMDREGNYVAIVTSPELNPKHDLYYQYCLETEDRYIAYVLNKKYTETIYGCIIRKTSGNKKLF